ncbi:unnamed protein product [Parnassius apollo]|uniref:(apollo) hypothetical protein n=1 Tax=Parnassius apollo TaxID=110799 RepID=A0A8S3Y1I0_PARAO|nr:unnamed protein product [Parnassius apollo]
MSYYMWMILLFAVAINGRTIPRNPLEKNILSFLTKWQADVLSIPSLKSLKIPPVQYNYQGRGIKMDYSIGDMELTGLNQFSIENIAASEKTLEVSLTLLFPVLTLRSEHYKLYGRAYYVYPLRGSGKMNIVFRNSIITATVRFTSDGGGTRIQDFLLNFDVKEIEADLENSSWPINTLLNTEGAQILEEYYSTIVEALWDYVVPTVNDYLLEVPPSRLLQIIVHSE